MFAAPAELNWYVATLGKCVVVSAVSAEQASERALPVLREFGAKTDIKTVRLATEDDIDLHGIARPTTGAP
jgi:hypothetical protein